MIRALVQKEGLVKVQIAPVVIVIGVFIWRVLESLDSPDFFGSLFWSVLTVAWVYLFGSFVLGVVLFGWTMFLTPYAKRLRDRPTRTLVYTFGSIAFLVAIGWCGALVGLGGGDAHCEVEPRGGVYCE